MPNYISRVLINNRVEVDRGEFPFTLPVFREFKGLELHPQITFFIGENGSGKSTLLQAIALNYGLPAEGGDKGYRDTWRVPPSGLDEKIILVKQDFPSEVFFFRSESFFNVIGFAEEAGLPRFGRLSQRSHGEGFLDAVATRKPPGLYLFDEPESALSIQGQFTLLMHLNSLLNEGSQIILATHSPILLGLGRGWIYEFSPKGIHRQEYRDTANYQLTLDFLKNRERYVDLLGLPPE